MLPCQGKVGPLTGAGVPAQSSPTGLGEKSVGDLISPDTAIDEHGNVTGTLKYVSGWREFSKSEASEQSGHFFPVKLSDEYKTKKIKVTGKKVKEATDTNWILRVENEESTFRFETEGQEIFTLKFNLATFA